MTDSSASHPDQPCCLVIEDHKEMRDFLCSSLPSLYPGHSVASCSDLQTAHQWLDQRNHLPNKPALPLVLVDLGLPDGSGLEILKRLNQSEPDTRCVVVTIFDDEASLFDALSAGAAGYLLKDEDPQFMIEILNRIRKGEPPLSPSIANRLLAHFKADGKPAPKKEAELTARETETLTLLAQGLTVPEAAKKMGLSAQTVAGYVKIIYQKLQVSSRAEATREAIRRGLA